MKDGDCSQERSSQHFKVSLHHSVLQITAIARKLKFFPALIVEASRKIIAWQKKFSATNCQRHWLHAVFYRMWPKYLFKSYQIHCSAPQGNVLVQLCCAMSHHIAPAEYPPPCQVIWLPPTAYCGGFQLLRMLKKSNREDSEFLKLYHVSNRSPILRG